MDIFFSRLCSILFGTISANSLARRTPDIVIRISSEVYGLVSYVMFEFYEKRRLKRVLYSTPMLGVLGMIAILMALPAWGAYQKATDTHLARLTVAGELRALAHRERELQTEIDRLSTSKGIEEEIRSKYEVGRTGEQLILVVGEEPAPPPPQPVQEPGFFEKFGL